MLGSGHCSLTLYLWDWSHYWLLINAFLTIWVWYLSHFLLLGLVYQNGIFLSEKIKIVSYNKMFLLRAMKSLLNKLYGRKFGLSFILLRGQGKRESR